MLHLVLIMLALIAVPFGLFALLGGGEADTAPKRTTEAQQMSMCLDAQALTAQLCEPIGYQAMDTRCPAAQDLMTKACSPQRMDPEAALRLRLAIGELAPQGPLEAGPLEAEPIGSPPVPGP